MANKEENSTAPDLPEPKSPKETKPSTDLPEIPADKKDKAVNEDQKVDKSKDDDVKERVPEPEDSPVNLQLVKYLMQVFDDSELTEFEVSQGDFQLMLSKNSSAPAGFIAPMAPQPAQANLAQSGSSSSKPEEDSNHFFIKSPMVGTFYRAASPDAEPFIDIGEKVKETTLVCIIEAMKVMNELPADCNGTIVDILVENGHGVEYGQPLFKVARN